MGRTILKMLLIKENDIITLRVTVALLISLSIYFSKNSVCVSGNKPYLEPRGPEALI